MKDVEALKQCYTEMGLEVLEYCDCTQMVRHYTPHTLQYFFNFFILACVHTNLDTLFFSLRVEIQFIILE